VEGKRGKQIVCSRKESENDLSSIPETHEIVESPNGQVTCRKKEDSVFLLEEIAFVQDFCQKQKDPLVELLAEFKKDAIIIHYKDISRVQELGQFLRCRLSEIDLRELSKSFNYEAVLKLELTNAESRLFTCFRMCWLGEADWMYLGSGPLPKLLKKYAPHIGKESFFEQF
jgi:hypothetical protein